MEAELDSTFSLPDFAAVHLAFNSKVLVLFDRFLGKTLPV